MSEISFSGPSGLYYDYKNDELFGLEFTGKERIATKTYEKLGKMYKYHGIEKNIDRKVLAITGMEYSVWIGEL